MDSSKIKILHNGAIVEDGLYKDPSFKLSNSYRDLEKWYNEHPKQKNLKHKASTVSYLFWNYFFPREMYREILPNVEKLKWWEQKDSFLKEYLKLTTLKKRSIQERIKALILSIIVYLHNKKVLFQYKKSQVLLIRYSEEDFRTKFIYEHFIKNKITVIQAIPIPSKMYLIKNLIKPKSNAVYLIWNKSFYQPRYFSLNSVDIQYANLVEDIEFGDKFHTQILKNTELKIAYGIDDVNFIFPLLRACRNSGIKTFGHQHGASYVPYHAGYFFRDLVEEDHVWYDNLVLWNDYWVDKANSCSNYYKKINLISGYNKHPVKSLTKLELEKIKYKENLNILIPYEFLASSYQVAEFIKRFIDKKNVVYLKLRNDDPHIDQIETYFLSENYLKELKIVKNITDDLMEVIDVIAGTQSALIYDLILYQKQIWLLETDFVFFEFMFDEGIASKVVLTENGYEIIAPTNIKCNYLQKLKSNYNSLENFLDSFIEENL